jgi:hypothetical protein
MDSDSSRAILPFRLSRKTSVKRLLLCCCTSRFSLHRYGIDEILTHTWEERKGIKIPNSEDVQLGNHAVNLDGTVLYADLVDSTGLVRGYKNWFAAEIYKMYLMVASELIRNNGGYITAFDGDRVMAVFIGRFKEHCGG